MDPQAVLKAQYPELSDAERTAMLASLTPAEREGMFDENLVDGIGQVGDPQEGEDGEADEPKPKPKPQPITKEPVEEEEEEELPAADGAAAEGTDASAEAQTDAAAEEDEDALPARVRLPNWRVPEDAKTKLEAIDADLVKAAEDFDAGDLSAREFQKRTNELNGQKQDLQSQITEATMAYRLNSAGWFGDVEAFLVANPVFRDNPRLHSLLDAEVKRLQEAADDPFDPKILREAKKQIQADIESLGGKLTTAKPAKETKPKLTVQPRQAPPPTIGRMPAADPTEVDTGQFAYLDRLQGEKHEKAMAKLSDADREAYLAR